MLVNSHDKYDMWNVFLCKDINNRLWWDFKVKITDIAQQPEETTWYLLEIITWLNTGKFSNISHDEIDSTMELLSN